MDNKPTVRHEQTVYAALLNTNVKLSLKMLTLSFIIYVTSIFVFHANTNVTKYWHLPLADFHHATGLQVHGGWNWVRQLNNVDMFSLAAVIYLASITIICYIRIVPIFFKNKDYVYGILAGTEVLILLLAASGILKAGGH